MMLDRTRPYATIYGVSDHAFEQDHKCFDHNGEEIGTEPEPKKRGPKPKDDQLTAQLKE